MTLLPTVEGMVSSGKIVFYQGINAVDIWTRTKRGMWHSRNTLITDREMVDLIIQKVEEGYYYEF